MVRVCKMLLSYCGVAGILHEALNSVTSSEAVHMMNGVEGRRRRAAYSKCFTASAVHNYYAVYNRVRQLNYWLYRTLSNPDDDDDEDL